MISTFKNLAGGVRRALPTVERPLDSANHFGVANSGEQFGIMGIVATFRGMPEPAVVWLARDEAILLAAWLKVLADPSEREFLRVCLEIEKT